MLYGTHGIGKSTWAAMAPKPIFIPTEEGANDIEVDKFDLCTSYDQVLANIGWLYENEHKYQTVVIDTLDWLERLIWDSLCRKQNVQSIEEYDKGYGKGYIAAVNQFREILAGLAALRNDREMEIVLLAHSQVKQFKNPETDNYDRFVPRIHQHASDVVQEWCDEVFFATYKVMTKAVDLGFNKKDSKGITTGERIIRTVERPSCQAKNRLNLPDEMPLDRTIYDAALTDFYKLSKSA